MTPGLNPHCALVRRLGQPAYESCKSCELRLQNCIQFRGQLYGTAIVTGVLATAFVPLPLAARAALAAVLVGVVFHFLRYVARESHLSIVTGARLRSERAEAITNLRTLQSTRDQLVRADKLATVGTMAAGVAHEINNPLAFVLSNLRFVREELEANSGSLDPELATAIAEAVAGGDRVRKIVSDLTALARVEEAKCGPTDLRGTMQSALALARNEVRHRARMVERYEAAPLAMADAGKLGQVFLNLIVNAVHAMATGSAADNQLTLGLSASGPWVLATVTDTGSGIPPEHIPRLFEPFFTTKAAGVGTGLGLAICQNIVVSMGGSIAVHSELGKGSTFTVQLPVATAGAVAASVPDTRPAAAVGPVRRARVLVIDDEPLVGRTISRILKGHEVVGFTDAAAALKALDADPRFDLVLCDVMMPELSGDEFHARLTASHPRLAALTVFMTGGAFTPSTRLFVASLPPHRCIGKPFDEALLRRLADG